MFTFENNEKKVYIDTSVVGGKFDKEFSADTIPFFEAVTKDKSLSSCRTF